MERHGDHSKHDAEETIGTHHALSGSGPWLGMVNSRLQHLVQLAWHETCFCASFACQGHRSKRAPAAHALTQPRSWSTLPVARRRMIVQGWMESSRYAFTFRRPSSAAYETAMCHERGRCPQVSYARVHFLQSKLRLSD